MQIGSRVLMMSTIKKTASLFLGHSVFQITYWPSEMSTRNLTIADRLWSATRNISSSSQVLS